MSDALTAAVHLPVGVSASRLENRAAVSVASSMAFAQATEDASIKARAHTVSTEEVSAWYGPVQAIDRVTMIAKPNTVTAIIGPSGCGKSTFIRCINRMHETIRGARMAGKILLDGEDVNASDVDPVQVRRLIGMVFQKPNPFPMMSIYDNVVAGLRLMGGHNKHDLDTTVERCLRSAALWDEVKDKLKASGASLSGGQQQRLCIARSLAVEPSILLMDEPCSALDPIATLKIEELMTELKRSLTIVIVTHNMQQAARVSDFTAFMLAGEERVGQLVEFGPTRQVFTNPRERRTEDYITGRFG
jgi:phosphate transport system ATP-binding protein